MSKIKKIYLIFLSTFIISLTANSGYAIIGVLKNRFVNKYEWLNEEEMNDYIALAQSSPGPVAINISTITGYKIAGILGSFAAILGCALPPIIIMIIVTYFYQTIISNNLVKVFLKGMQVGVVALLLDIVFGLFINISKEKDILKYLLIIISFIYVRYSKLSIFYLIIFCIIISLIKSLLIKGKVDRL